jgi:hypothetical protein
MHYFFQQLQLFINILTSQIWCLFLRFGPRARTFWNLNINALLPSTTESFDQFYFTSQIWCLFLRFGPKARTFWNLNRQIYENHSTYLNINALLPSTTESFDQFYFTSQTWCLFLRFGPKARTFWNLNRQIYENHSTYLNINALLPLTAKTIDQFYFTSQILMLVSKVWAEGSNLLKFKPTNLWESLDIFEYQCIASFNSKKTIDQFYFTSQILMLVSKVWAEGSNLLKFKPTNLWESLDIFEYQCIASFNSWNNWSILFYKPNFDACF